MKNCDILIKYIQTKDETYLKGRPDRVRAQMVSSYSMMFTICAFHEYPYKVRESFPCWGTLERMHCTFKKNVTPEVWSALLAEGEECIKFCEQHTSSKGEVLL